MSAWPFQVRAEIAGTRAYSFEVSGHFVTQVCEDSNRHKFSKLFE